MRQPTRTFKSLLLCGLLAAPAGAQTCPVPLGASPDLAQRGADERLRFLQSHLAQEKERAEAWQRDWTVVLAALTVGPLMLATRVKDRAQREDFGFGAATSAITLGAIYLWPPPAFESFTLGTQSDPCEQLNVLEMRFQKIAAREQEGRGPHAHVRTFLINLAVALFGLGTTLGHWQSAILGSASGTATGELMLMTQPVQLDADWREYLRGLPRRPPVVIGLPELGPVGGGTGVRWGVRF